LRQLHAASTGPEEGSKVGYKRALERHPDLGTSVTNFEKWLGSGEIWLTWVDDHIPDNIHTSQLFHPVNIQGLTRMEINSP
jgi:hypothetical protein